MEKTEEKEMKEKSFLFSGVLIQEKDNRLVQMQKKKLPKKLEKNPRRCQRFKRFFAVTFSTF